jgi:hypothetical protein
MRAPGAFKPSLPHMGTLTFGSQPLGCSERQGRDARWERTITRLLLHHSSRSSGFGGSIHPRRGATPESETFPPVAITCSGALCPRPCAHC